MSDPYTDEHKLFLERERKRFEKNERRYKSYANGKKKTRRLKNKSRDEYRKTMKRCKYCKSTENLTVDHKVPLSAGGRDTQNNWQCLCHTCNSNKSSRSEKEIKHLFKWFLKIQESRVSHGNKPYSLR